MRRRIFRRRQDLLPLRCDRRRPRQIWVTSTSSLGHAAISRESNRPSPADMATCRCFASAVELCVALPSATQRRACALSEWNARCEPPWTEDKLRAKLESARRYGREPVGALEQRS